jgi:acyl carrier protein
MVSLWEAALQQTDIAPRVRKIIAEHYGKDLPLVLDASNFADDLGGDDLTRIGMAFEIEVEFGVSVDDDDICRFQTPADVIGFVTNRLTPNGASQ